MIRSFKSHVKKYPNSKLVIGGQGPLMEQLQTQIAQLELERNVNLKGWMDKRAIKDQMLRSHAFVHSSRVETFGVVLIEAMSCGLPIVATRSGGPQEFVKAEHGYLVDVGDQERLSESLNKMVENYSDFDRVAISKYVNENFSAQGISERLGELYRSITD
jgi:glycosyltransferase involved in cell wall biosynthesis